MSRRQSINCFSTAAERSRICASNEASLAPADDVPMIKIATTSACKRTSSAKLVFFITSLHDPREIQASTENIPYDFSLRLLLKGWGKVSDRQDVPQAEQ